MTAATARHQSPETSHQAALRLELSGDRKSHDDIVLAAIARHPGRTGWELSRITGLMITSVRPRLTGLFHDGKLTQGPARKCEVMGSPQRTWYAVEEQGGLPL